MNPPLSLLFIVLFLFALQTHVHAGVEHDVPNCAIPCGVRAASGAGCTPQCDCLEPCFIPWYVLFYISLLLLCFRIISTSSFLRLPPSLSTFHRPLTSTSCFTVQTYHVYAKPNQSFPLLRSASPLHVRARTKSWRKAHLGSFVMAIVSCFPGDNSFVIFIFFSYCNNDIRIDDLDFAYQHQYECAELCNWGEGKEAWDGKSGLGSRTQCGSGCVGSMCSLEALPKVMYFSFHVEYIWEENRGSMHLYMLE